MSKELKDANFKDREKLFGPLELNTKYTVQLMHDGSKRIVLIDLFVGSQGDYFDDDGDEIDSNNWSLISWQKATK